MSYGKVYAGFWTDEKIVDAPDDAKLVALYLLSGPHRNMIGCYRVPAEYIVGDLKWPIDRVSAALSALGKSGFLVRDERTGWTLICNQLKYDPIGNDKHAKAAARLAMDVPKSSPVFAAMRERLMPHLDRLLNGHEGIVGYPIDTPSAPSDIAKPSPEPYLAPYQAPAPDNYVPAVADTGPDLGAAVDRWNALASELGFSLVQKATKTRKAALRARLDECGGLEGWDFALTKVRDSPFLRGENDRGWKADFDFILKPAKFTKLMEGGYDRKGSHSHSGNGLTGAAAALAELAGDPAG